MTPARARIGILATRPIPYYVPWYRRLGEAVDLDVLYCHRQTAEDQARAGFGIEEMPGLPRGWQPPTRWGAFAPYTTRTRTRRLGDALDHLVAGARQEWRDVPAKTASRT